MRIFHPLCLAFLSLTTLYARDPLIVTSLADHGPGTLREALDNALTKDIIQFDPLLSGTILLESDLPPITVPQIAINGPINNSITIDGVSTYRVFDVQNGPFTLTSINLTNGSHVAQGGAIYLAGDLYAYVKNVAITQASGSSGENSLFVESSAVLELLDVSFLPTIESQIYLNGGHANITATTPLTFVIDGISGSQVYKYGPSLATISTPPSITASYYIAIVEGTLSLSGELTGSASVLDKGTLQGEFTILNLNNLGAVQPGVNGAFGTMVITGVYFPMPGDTQIKLDPSNNVDLLQIGGNALLLNAGLTLLPESGTYTAGSKYTFLTAGGSVMGRFLSIDMGGLNAKINYHPQFVEIEILTTQTL